MVIVFVLAVASTTGAVLTSFLRNNRVTSIVRWQPLNRAELVLEQKEFGYWLLKDAGEFKRHHPSSAKLTEFLNSLSLLAATTSSQIVSSTSHNCLHAALLAVQTGAKRDARFFNLLETLTETLIDTSLQATSFNTSISLNTLKNMKTLATLNSAFQGYNKQDLRLWKPGTPPGIAP